LPLLLAVLGHRRELYCLALLATALQLLALFARQQQSDGRSLSSRAML